MYKSTSPLFLICETPLHAGSGDDLGIVDLPIQRERHTSFPKIESSSIKGALREAFEGHTLKNLQEDLSNKENIGLGIHKINRVFGFDESPLKSFSKEDLKALFRDGDKEFVDFAGCIAFTDVRLLLFPVKSMKGVFVWVTCPQVLNRLAVDIKIADKTPMPVLEYFKNVNLKEGTALVSNKSSIAFGESIVLEEYAFSAKETDEVKDLAQQLSNIIFKDGDLQYWNATLKTNLVVLNNDDFRDFVNQSTEVITRTKIDNESGTVADGALFTEEYLPNDSVMYSLVMFSDEYSKRENDKMKAEEVKDFFNKKIDAIKMFQLGGNATLGKGLLRTQLLD
jgi:CRISPR-associated protein Cmr4